MLHSQGKTGKAVQDLYTPEIAATKSGYNTGDPMSIMNYDQTHTNVRRALTPTPTSTLNALIARTLPSVASTCADPPLFVSAWGVCSASAQGRSPSLNTPHAELCALSWGITIVNREVPERSMRL